MLQKEFDKIRKKFPALKDSVYLFNHSLGAMPEKAEKNLAKYTDIWKNQHATAWEDSWWNLCVELGGYIENLLGAPKHSVCLQSNVTTATAAVLSCFEPTKEKNTIVYTDLHFPSIIYLLRSWYGDKVNYKVVKSDDGITVSTEKLLEAIDDSTLLVPISHSIYCSSYLQDIQTITQKAHDHDAFVIADIYQSAGAVPIDVMEWDVDFAVGGSIKWLCGGPGTAYLYIRPDILPDLNPKLTGWIGHDNPFEFASEMRHSMNGSYRFMTGTPNIPGMFASRAGFKMISRIGAKTVRERSLKLTRIMLDRAAEMDVTVKTPLDDERRGGTVMIDHPKSQAISEKLKKKKYVIDWRPAAGIRISPHVFSTTDEVNSIMDEIGKMVR